MLSTFQSAMIRQLQPELLDSLPPHHPDAIQSRRDLRLIDAAMGNSRWILRTLPPLLRPGEPVLELGAGTGELSLALQSRGVASDAIDRCPGPARWPAGRAWFRQDLREFSGFAAYPAVVGSLVLHHFSDTELAALGARLRAHGRLVVACEPARRLRFQRLFAAIAPLFRASHVTLHDARVSIAAGFRGDELPRALGLASPEWDCRVSTSLLGAYRLVAVRRP
jgi:2-polyprenyl-3-methyl-5-hydroxy-6-metoxy-1,4-benzoquinol methylase